MIDLDKLRALAEKATPGPWRVPNHCGFGVERDIDFRDKRRAPATVVMAVGAKKEYPSRPDSEYIAAVSPDVILALLDALDAAGRTLANVKRRHEPHGERGRCWSCGQDTYGDGCTEYRDAEQALEKLRSVT